MTRLQRRLLKVNHALTCDPTFGYWLSLLEELHLYGRLWKIFADQDPDPLFGRIPVETKRMLREILIETKHDLPFYWSLEYQGSLGDQKHLTKPGLEILRGDRRREKPALVGNDSQRNDFKQA